MRQLFIAIFTAGLLATSCTESKTTMEEQKEIDIMDSTEQKMKQQMEKLEDQTQKVEESLENLEKEFSSEN